MLLILILTLLMGFRASSVTGRLKAVYQKKRDRKELQTVNYINKLRMIGEEKHKEVVMIAPNANRKRLVNLNKNVTSILLPYLTVPELLKVEQVSKLMAMHVGNWPVWKNIYFDFYLEKQKERLPPHEREMTEEEQESHDYRAACKRCFVFIQKNLTDEDLAVAPDIADYYKGEAFIILEEFTLSLMEFPRVNNMSLSAVEFVAAKTEKALAYLDPYMTINLSFGIQT